MSELWRNLIVSISVLALSGVSYLGFTEPPIYEVVFKLLIATIALVFAVGSIWNLAIAYADQAARKAVLEYQAKKPDQLAYPGPVELMKVTEEHLKRLTMPVWVYPVCGLICLYLVGLREIPSLREDLEKPIATTNQPHSPQPQQKVP